MIKKVEDMSVEIHNKTLDMEQQEKMEDFILQIYQLKTIVEQMRSHNEKVYKNNLPNQLQQRVKNARDYAIKLFSNYMITDDLNEKVISNKEAVDKFKFTDKDVQENLKG